MSKKIWSVLLTVLLAATVFAGCSSGSGESSTVAENPSTPDAAGEESPSEELPGGEESESVSESAPAETGEGGLRIAIVTSPSGVDDGSFNQDNYNGIQAFIKNHPDAVVKDVQEQDIANSVQAVEQILADYDVIVTPGFQFSGITQMAQDNPDKKFVLIDAYPADESGEVVEVDNIYAMQFKEQESGFYAGIAAALKTQSGKVAVVNGIAYPSNVNYQYGFEAGVTWAVDHLGATAEVVTLPSYQDATYGGNYVGDFNDEGTGKVVGNALLAEGVDVIFVAAGGSGNGVFTAVKENGNAKVIGCDVDQFDDGAGGDGNIVLTSVLKVMSINVERALDAVQDGSFKGGNYLLGADTDSTGYVKESGRHQLSDKALEELGKVEGMLKSGEIAPPSFTEGTPEAYTGK